MQSSSFNEVSDNSLDDWNVFVHKNNEFSNNLSIIDAIILNEFISLNKELEVEVLIENNSMELAKNALLIFNIDNINVGQIQFDLGKNSITKKVFKTIIDKSGTHNCSVEVIYDKNYGDNKFLFNLNIPEKIKIGLLSNNNEDHLYIKKSIEAYRKNFTNIEINYENELLKNENLIINNDVNFIFGYNYIYENNIKTTKKT